MSPYKFINANQTNEERRKKYRFVREKGFSSHIARRLRDWRWSKIKRFIELFENWKEWV